MRLSIGALGPKSALRSSVSSLCGVAGARLSDARLFGARCSVRGLSGLVVSRRGATGGSERAVKAWVS